MPKVGSDRLWDLAAAELLEREAGRGQDDGGQTVTDRTVFVMGSKAGGKSSIVLRCLDRDEATRPTLALEYTFGRRSRGTNTPRDTVHVWELGGGTSLWDLLKIPVTRLCWRSLSVVLVLDLSEPRSLWGTMETLLQATQAQLETVSSQARSRPPTGRVLPKDHPDRELICPFPVSLLIIGSKYDLFQDLESEKKKLISKSLRFVAHYYAASLMFSSMKTESLVLKTRSFFSHLAFGAERGKTVCCDSTKPLIIPAGSDSFGQIGSPPCSDLDATSLLAKTPWDLWKKVFERVFPPEVDVERQQVKDPARDPQYSEPQIDAMRAQKDQELEQYKKNVNKSWKELNLDN